MPETQLGKELSALRKWAGQGVMVALGAMRELETALGAFVADERTPSPDDA